MHALTNHFMANLIVSNRKTIEPRNSTVIILRRLNQNHAGNFLQQDPDVIHAD